MTAFPAGSRGQPDPAPSIGRPWPRTNPDRQPPPQQADQPVPDRPPADETPDHTFVATRPPQSDDASLTNQGQEPGARSACYADTLSVAVPSRRESDGRSGAEDRAARPSPRFVIVVPERCGVRPVSIENVIDKRPWCARRSLN